MGRAGTDVGPPGTRAAVAGRSPATFRQVTGDRNSTRASFEGLAPRIDAEVPRK
jgi:hypothetical protein